MPKIYDCIVIGAGAAGLAACRELTSAQKSVLVLEASNRIGGRINTYHDGPSLVELGAEFIHGNNVITHKLAAEFGINLSPISGKPIVHTDQTPKEKSELLHEIDDGVWDKINHYSGPDISISQFIDGHYMGVRAKKVLKGMISDLESADTSKLSTRSMSEAMSFAQINDQDFYIPKGYSKVIDSLAAGQNIRIGHSVSEIFWSPQKAKVMVGGSVYHSKSVIITVPLGILKLNRIKFTPNLPDDYINAIKNIGFGDLIKVVLWFSQLPPNFNEIASMGKIHSWWTNRTQHNPAVIGFIGGNSAKILSGKSDDFLIGLAIDELCCILGASIRAKFIAGKVQNWVTDPWTMGGYGYNRVDQPLSLHKLLAAPIDNTLYFAGEAAAQRSWEYATVHGAINSGLYSANMIINNTSTAV